MGRFISRCNLITKKATGLILKKRLPFSLLKLSIRSTILVLFFVCPFFLPVHESPLVDWDVVLSAGDDVAAPALGQSNFLFSLVSSIIFSPLVYKVLTLAAPIYLERFLKRVS
jgi:hypothetical protein